MTVFMPSPKNLSNVEVLGPQKRRRWSPEEKLAIVQQGYEPGYDAVTPSTTFSL